MIVNVLSTHRFHLLDLARELSDLGHDVRYYSYVPTRRCAEFGIQPSVCSCFLWLVWPFFILERLLPVSVHEHLHWCRNHWIDWLMAYTMRQCDVCIALGYVYQQSLVAAKSQWNAVTVMEWGSLHIVEQLRQFGTLDSYPKWKLRWEVDGYGKSDYIALPSVRSLHTFLQNGVTADRLFVNPYGVDLVHFPPTCCTQEYDLLFVGGWRYEKGCDLITQLCEQYHYRFLHVGAVVNMPFPEHQYMTHVDAVDQNALEEYYAKAKVFIMPSRADGFGMVLLQAASCGLPIVCSANTGAADLKQLLGDSQWVLEDTEMTIDSLHDLVEQALQMAGQQTGQRRYSSNHTVKNLSWNAYGKRYDQWLRTVAVHSN